MAGLGVDPARRLRRRERDKIDSAEPPSSIRKIEGSEVVLNSLVMSTVTTNPKVFTTLEKDD